MKSHALVLLTLFPALVLASPNQKPGYDQDTAQVATVAVEPDPGYAVTLFTITHKTYGFDVHRKAFKSFADCLNEKSAQAAISGKTPANVYCSLSNDGFARSVPPSAPQAAIEKDAGMFSRAIRLLGFRD